MPPKHDCLVIKDSLQKLDEARNALLDMTDTADNKDDFNKYNYEVHLMNRVMYNFTDLAVRMGCPGVLPWKSTERWTD